MISISTAIGLRVLHSSIHYECLECGELVPLGCCTCGPHRRLRPAGLPAELLEALKALLFIADSHQKTRQACVCDAMKPGFTCPYCKARAAIAKAEV